MKQSDIISERLINPDLDRKTIKDYDKFLAGFNKLSDSGAMEDLTDEEKDILEGLNESFNYKAVAIGVMITKFLDASDLLDGDILFHKNKIADLKERQEGFNKKANSMKTFLLYLMQKNNRDEIITPNYTIKVCKKRKYLKQIIGSLTPETIATKFQNIKTTITFSKTKIKEAIEKGEVVDGFVVVNDEQEIKIKG